MNLLSAMAVVIVSSFIGALGGLFIKKGAKTFSLNILKLLRNNHIICGIFLYAISAILAILALKKNPLSVIYPLASTQYIWTTLFSVRFLHENMNIMKWLGISCVILGVICVGFGSG